VIQSGVNDGLVVTFPDFPEAVVIIPNGKGGPNAQAAAWEAPDWLDRHEGAAA